MFCSVLSFGCKKTTEEWYNDQLIKLDVGNFDIDGIAEFRKIEKRLKGLTEAQFADNNKGNNMFLGKKFKFVCYVTSVKPVDGYSIHKLNEAEQKFIKKNLIQVDCTLDKDSWTSTPSFIIIVKKEYALKLKNDDKVMVKGYINNLYPYFGYDHVFNHIGFLYLSPAIAVKSK